MENVYPIFSISYYNYIRKYLSSTYLWTVPTQRYTIYSRIEVSVQLSNVKFMHLKWQCNSERHKRIEYTCDSELRNNYGYTLKLESSVNTEYSTDLLLLNAHSIVTWWMDEVLKLRDKGKM